MPAIPNPDTYKFYLLWIVKIPVAYFMAILLVMQERGYFIVIAESLLGVIGI